MQTALVTGGASLLGEGVTRCLVARGWHVFVTDINLDGAQKVASIVSGSGKAESAKLDVTCLADIAAQAQRILGETGRIDALVNIAGGARGVGIPKMPFAEMSPELYRRTLDLNFVTVLNACHAVLPFMIKAKRGGIVSMAASRGLKGGPNASIYSAAKAAIIVFSQALAQEVGHYGIRVNSIAPGSAEARWKIADQEPSRSPLGRHTSADDVGRGVAFLLSDDASHITGSCLDISGGTSLH